MRRRESGVLKGMNEFPSVLADSRSPEEILKGWGVKNFTLGMEKHYTHIFTHIRWAMTAYPVTAEETPFPVYSEEELKRDVSLPTAFKQCEELLYLLG